jgi:hypothetical protein
MLRQLFESLGDVEVFAIVPGSGAYVEMKTGAQGAAAIKALHGQVIGSRVLLVQLATEAMRAGLLAQGIPCTGMMGEADGVPPGEGGPRDEAVVERDAMGDVLALNIPLHVCLETFVEARAQLRATWPVVIPTRILVLLNLFDSQEVESDASYEGLRKVIEDEVEAHGRVRNFFMPREGPPPPLPPDEPTALPKPEKDADGGPDAEREYEEALEGWELASKRQAEEAEAALMRFLDEKAAWELECLHPVRGMRAVGRVFVEYETVEEAEAALRAIRGRTFNGRTVVTSFLFEDVLYPELAEAESDAEEVDAASPTDVAAAANASAPAAEAVADEAGGADDID